MSARRTLANLIKNADQYTSGVMRLSQCYGRQY